MAGNDGAWYPISVPLPPVEVRKLKRHTTGGGNGWALPKEGWVWVGGVNYCVMRSNLLCSC